MLRDAVRVIGRESRSAVHALEPFGGWLPTARAASLWRRADDFQSRLPVVLGAAESAPEPRDVQVLARWTRDGVDGEVVSWGHDWGPRTEAFVLRPAGHADPLPGVLTLHSHGGVKSVGKEVAADGPQGRHPAAMEGQVKLYGGRAFANELARRGYVVLAHDGFSWGCRGFTLEAMGCPPCADEESVVEQARYYDQASRAQELVLEKLCTVLGTSMAGQVLREDRTAASYLLSRDDVAAQPLAAVGLSGGGCRAAMLAATTDLSGCVIVGMMSTYAELLDRHVAGHTWMFFPLGLARIGDWPDVASARAPLPLLVQYCRGDHLFPLEGMVAADAKIREQYARCERPQAYRAEWYPGPHRFDLSMQDSAFRWLSHVTAAWRNPQA